MSMRNNFYLLHVLQVECPFLQIGILLVLGIKRQTGQVTWISRKFKTSHFSFCDASFIDLSSFNCFSSSKNLPSFFSFSLVICFSSWKIFFTRSWFSLLAFSFFYISSFICFSRSAFCLSTFSFIDSSVETFSSSSLELFSSPVEYSSFSSPLETFSSSLESLSSMFESSFKLWILVIKPSLNLF